MIRASAAALAPLLVALVLPVACGGSDDGKDADTPATTAPTAPTDTKAATTEEEAEPQLVVGAVDDAARQAGPMLQQLADAGLNAVAVTSFWEPGLAEPAPGELAVLADAGARAEALGLRLFVAVYHRGSATTPLTDAARREFASYVAAIVEGVPQAGDVVVGNEPNLNRFWLPQFGPGGEDVASGAYFSLLAEAYDAAKQANADVRVWGGALAPRGIDRPGTGRDTQSPRRFLEGLAEAYRASGRKSAPLDGFAFHPYPASSAVPPDHPSPAASTSLGLADHDRLQLLLRKAFGGDLPILYSELGVETAIPAGKRSLYRDREVGKPVDEATQADYYRRALELVACQQNVEGLLLFHSHDEPSLVGFQSGVYYVDGTPKASLEPVRDAIRTAVEKAARGC